MTHLKWASYARGTGGSGNQAGFYVEQVSLIDRTIQLEIIESVS